MITNNRIGVTLIGVFVFCLWTNVPPSAGESPPFHTIKLGPGTLDLSAELRWRYELLDQFNIKTYGTGSSDPVLLGRLRLDLCYRLGPGIELFVQGQDARFWLSDDIDKRDFIQSCPYDNEYDLRQAYVRWRHIAKSAMGFQIGRQTISYGGNRIFGPGEWGNVGRYTWDAGKLLWQSDGLDLDLVYGKRVLYLWDQFDDTHFDDDVYAVYAQIKAFSQHRTDLFYIVKHNDDQESSVGESGTGKLLVQSLGYHGTGQWHQMDYTANAVYQFGDFGKDDLRAFGLIIEMGYTFAHHIKPRLAAGLAYASGDEDPTDGDCHTFDGVFGAVDQYYGRMNLFAWMNLVDWQAGLSVTPVNGMKVGLDYHRFRLAEKKDAWYYANGKKMRRDKLGKAGSELGEEIDLICKYKLTPRLELMAGYGIFFPGTFIETTGSHETAQWFFTQIQLCI